MTEGDGEGGRGAMKEQRDLNGTRTGNGFSEYRANSGRHGTYSQRIRKENHFAFVYLSAY